jgi:hypothetical protein
MMKVLKAAFIIAGRANQTHNSIMRENIETRPVKHPELLDLILMTIPFQGSDSVEQAVRPLRLLCMPLGFPALRHADREADRYSLLAG